MKKEKEKKKKKNRDEDRENEIELVRCQVVDRTAWTIRAKDS